MRFKALKDNIYLDIRIIYSNLKYTAHVVPQLVIHHYMI